MRLSLFYVAALCVALQVYAPAAWSNPAGDELNQRGMEELKSGNNAAAVDYFKKAIEKDPSRKHYYNNLAAAYMRMEDYGPAEQQLLLAIAIDPLYTRALSNMAVLCFKTGRYREAYGYYKKAKESNPEYTAERFDREKTLKRLRELSEKNPDDENLKKMIRYLEEGGE